MEKATEDIYNKVYALHKQFKIIENTNGPKIALTDNILDRICNHLKEIIYQIEYYLEKYIFQSIFEVTEEQLKNCLRARIDDEDNVKSLELDRDMCIVIKVMQYAFNLTSQPKFTSLTQSYQENYLLLRKYLFSYLVLSFPKWFQKDFSVNFTEESTATYQSSIPLFLAVGDYNPLVCYQKQKQYDILCVHLPYFIRYLQSDTIVLTINTLKKIQVYKINPQGIFTLYTQYLKEKLRKWLITADLIVVVVERSKYVLYPTLSNRSSCSIFTKIFSKGPSIIEIKEYTGDIANGIFTLLNISEHYNETHINNITGFSLLSIWLNAIHKDLKELKIVFDPGLEQAIMQYNFRLFEQSQKVYDFLQKIDVSQKGIYYLLEQEYLEATISEIIKIFNTLLFIDKKNLNPIIEEIKRIYPRIIKKQTGFSFLRYLEIMINNKTEMLIDLETPIKEYFEQILPESLGDSILCMQTMEFLEKYKVLLDKTTSTFEFYYPAILKIVANYPHTLMKKFFSMMPIMIKKDNFIDIFEGIIDLPLVTRIIEMMNYLKSSDINLRDQEAFNKPYGDLINFFTRNSTTTLLSPQMEDEKMKYMGHFFRCLPPLIKEKVVSDHLDEILKIYFDLIQKIDNNGKKVELLRTILKRYSRLFINKEIKSEVKAHMLKFAELQIKTYPVTLKLLYENIKATIFDLENVENEELILHLVYIASETFAISKIDNLNAQRWREVGKNYCELFEILIYKLVNNLSPNNIFFGGSENKQPDPERNFFKFRMMQILINAFLKIGLQFKELVPKILAAYANIHEKSDIITPGLSHKIKTNVCFLKNIE